MMFKGGQVVSEHSDPSSRSNSPSPSKTPSDNQYEIPCEGDLLVIRRILGTIPTPFSFLCLITNKLCSMIIDWGSCANAESTRFVENLGLPNISHTNPYKLQWLTAEGEIMVNKQVIITFAIGKYKEEVLCDVVPMEATHILLGRPWQYDRQVLHDGLTNKMTFTFPGHKVTLKPLSPKVVHEDQIKMKKKEKMKKRKK